MVATAVDGVKTRFLRLWKPGRCWYLTENGFGGVAEKEGRLAHSAELVNGDFCLVTLNTPLTEEK